MSPADGGLTVRPLSGTVNRPRRSNGRRAVRARRRHRAHPCSTAPTGGAKLAAPKRLQPYAGAPVPAIPPGCQYTARVRAVGENGRGHYAYMPAARLSGPGCEDLLPAPPTGVEAEAGAFNELERGRAVSVTWSQGGAIEAQFYQVRFGGGTDFLYRTADQPFVASVAAGKWDVQVQAGVTVDGASGHSGPPVTGVRPELARIAVPAPKLSAYDALVEGSR